MGTFDQYGNPDPNGLYDVSGNLIGSMTTSTTSLSAAPAGSPPPPGGNSIWSTVASLVSSATAATTSIVKTVNSNNLATAKTNLQVAQLATQPPSWLMWGFVGVLVVVAIWLLK